MIERNPNTMADGVEMTTNKRTHVMAYRLNPEDATQGYALYVGAEVVELTAEQADDLGRYLLFDGTQEPAPEPTPEVPAEPVAPTAP